VDHHIDKRTGHAERDELDGDPAHADPGSKSDEPELKITVRKLEVPVRPRGVLAE